MLEKENLARVKDPKPSSDSHMLEKDKWHNALKVAPLKIDSKALNHKT